MLNVVLCDVKEHDSVQHENNLININSSLYICLNWAGAVVIIKHVVCISYTTIYYTKTKQRIEKRGFMDTLLGYNPPHFNTKRWKL